MANEPASAAVKAALRREMAVLRREAAASPQRAEWDAAIVRQVVRLRAYQSARVLGVYLNTPEEAATDAIIAAALARRATVAAPRANARDGTLAMHVLTDPAHVVAGPWGIREPAGESAPLPPERLDFVLVPGLAFSPDGRRLGHGGGFFDRYLARVRPDCLKAGLAYDAQIRCDLPADPWDVALDLVVTPNRVHGSGRR